ncbi:MAG: flippase-like domain-containing protein [Kofleriaceae bacterium]|nr:flippase-like domain-containing protein [Kofleriaceae bacterium]
MKNRSKALLLLVILAVVAFAGISIYTDVGDLGDSLSGFKWWAFAAALGLSLFNYLLRFVRWSLYLRNADIRLETFLSVRIFLSGFALSVTPGKLGELLKCYLLRDYKGVPIAKSAPLVVGERVSDLTALLVLALIGFAIYGVAGPLIVIAGLFILSGLIVLAWPRLAQACITALTYPGFLRRFREPLLEFYVGLASLVRPWPLCWATGIASVAWLAECVGFTLILAAFPGTHVPFGLAILIYAATTVAGALSFLPGGLLVTEAGMTLLLVESARGVDEPTALAATILTRLATLWFAVVIGVITLTMLRRAKVERNQLP